MLMEKTRNQLINEELMQPKQHYKNDNEVRIAILENSVSHIYQSLERIEKNIEKGFDGIDKKFSEKFDGINKKIDVVNDSLIKRMDKVEDLTLKNLYFTLGLMSSLVIGIIITIAHNFHWIGN
jgi:hypothetical protein